MKFLIKFLLREHSEDEATEKTRKAILDAIKNKILFEKHKHFFVQIVNYFNEKKRFTNIHYEAVRRLADG